MWLCMFTITHENKQFFLMKHNIVTTNGSWKHMSHLVWFTAKAVIQDYAELKAGLEVSSRFSSLKELLSFSKVFLQSH